MRRSGRRRIVQVTGETLPFPAATFAAVLIGWVLHHDAPDLDAARILREAARVTLPGGRLISIEPLSDEFDRSKWLGLLDAAGFVVSQRRRFLRHAASARRGGAIRPGGGCATSMTQEMERLHASLDFTGVINAHLARRPAQEPLDVYKLLYQGILGPEHLIASPQDFEARLVSEVQSIAAIEDEPLWESIRPDGTLGRLNLRPFKARDGDIRALNAACLQTVTQVWGTKEMPRAVWNDFVAACRSGRWPLSWLDIQHLSKWLDEHNFPAVHHTVRPIAKNTLRPIGWSIVAE